MPLSIHNRALLRGMLAGAVALAGTSACSRDRAETGRDTTQVGETGTAVTPPDTQAGVTTQSASSDTARVETATPTPAPAKSPSRREAQDTAAPSAGEDVSGYQAMGHVGDDSASDTTSAEMANAAVDTTTTAEADTMAGHHAMADTAAGQDVSTDTTAAGYEPMARDTSTALAQGDTTAPVATDTTAQTETDSASAGVETDTVATATEPVRPPEDSTEVYGQVSGEPNADSLPSETERIRPPEDSTELLGNATDTTAQAEADSGTVTAQLDTTTQAETGAQAESDTVTTATEPIAEAKVEADADAEANVEAVGDANADAVGAAQVASTGNTLTGAAAVATMTREGQRCTVVDPEESPEVRWDLASSPATLNPCGIGTMQLPRIRTGEK